MEETFSCEIRPGNVSLVSEVVKGKPQDYGENEIESSCRSDECQREAGDDQELCSDQNLAKCSLAIFPPMARSISMPARA